MNFYEGAWNGRVYPRTDEQSQAYYWPTPDEMRLIDEILSSDAYIEHYFETYGPAKAQALNEHVFRDYGAQYGYLAKNLPQHIEGDELTQAAIESCLAAFEAEVVTRWLEKWGNDFQ